MPEHYQHRRARRMGGIFAVVVFCALQVFQRWQELGRPFAVESPLELFAMALLVATCLKLLTIFKGPRERFIVVVAMVVLLSGLAASFLNPIASLARHTILVLWLLASLMGLSMFVWPPQSPRIEVKAGEIKYRMLIFLVFAVSAVVVGVLMYFLPFR
jgi:hypothetical protein